MCSWTRSNLPDRDNTFAAFDYWRDGTIHECPGDAVGKRTLDLTGLNNPIREVFDENKARVAMDRVADRMTVWGIALDSKEDLETNPTDHLRRQIIRTATFAGFFSIWMTVFESDAQMRQLVIDGFGKGFEYCGFAGTAKDCFDNQTLPVSPRPDNTLGGAGKI